MVEYVFKPSRMVDGKRVVSRLYSGAYSLARGEKARRACLHTPSRKVAESMLRKLIIEKQSEREGLIAPAAIRETAASSLMLLVSEYRADLTGRSLAVSHVKETISRLERMFAALKWSRLSDVRPDKYVAWRATLNRSAKTKKEFQTSANAFFNWLVRLGRLAVNPLARVDRVDTRGKAVRKSRAFTQAEIVALLAAAPAGRRLVYLFLLYTGARKNEAASLRWSDVDLTGRGSVLFRAENTKGKQGRPVPLRPELVGLLESHCLALEVDGGMLHELVFSPFPSDDALHSDLKSAGIPRQDASGRIVHFHAFRKTFQTWGAVAGVGQRSAQEMLGHSDPSLTSGVYTDVAALQLHDEVSKLPWVGVAGDAHKPVKIATASRFRGLLAELVELAKGVVSEGEASELAGVSLAARHGFEP